MKRPVIAAFDFDGTITYRDSLLPFLIFTNGWLKSFFYFLLESPFLLAYLVGLYSRQGTKERILTRFFKGKSTKKIREWGRSFVEKDLYKRVKPEAMDRLQWHLEQGHRCIIVSASIDIYLEPWAESFGVHDVICSRLASPNGFVTGKLLGANCWGPEKVRRLEEEFGNLEDYKLFAYGDSRGDRELLAAADHPFYRTYS